MILFPAIDLKEGRCVRLKQGDMAQATVFNDDPAAQAADFEAQGFQLATMTRTRPTVRIRRGRASGAVRRRSTMRTT